jgi:hypothetical protein
MDKLDLQAAEEIYQQVDLEQEILKKMLETLDAYESGSFTVPITTIKQLLAKIENTDFASTPSKTAKRTAKIARYLFTILSDLRFLVKESKDSPNKEVLLKEIDNLIARVKKLLDNYYYYYQYIPEPRYIEKWYYGYRNHYHYLPYYDYSRYYETIYPDKRKFLSTDESIWHDIVHGSDDRDESTLFVPKQFQGTQSEYDEYLIWKAKKELEQMRSSHYNKTPLELQRESDKLLDVAEKIIRAERRRYMQT